MAKITSPEKSEPQSLRILMVEDSEDDALLVIQSLKKGGYNPVYERVESAEAMRAALREKAWDVILCDYQMPRFNGLAAIALLKEAGIDIPLIIVSGAIGEETAVECMRLGANDYVMKGNLSRLAAAVERELKEAETRHQRIRAEETLRKNEAQLSNALEMAHLGHWEYEVADDLFTFNDHFYKIFRTTAKEVGGYTMHSAEYAQRFVHPDDMYMVGEETRKAIETTDPHFNRQIEHRILYADGTVGYIAVRFFIVKDSHGRTVKTYGVNQDITERKRAEEAIEESENKFRAMFENMAAATCLDEIIYENGKAVDYRIIDVNPAFEKIMGVIKKDTVGKRASTLYGGGEIPFLDAYIKVAETGQPISFEAYFPPINKYLYITASCPGKGKFSTVFSDITERKQMEVKQRQQTDAMEAAIDGMAILNKEEKYVYLNKAHAEIYGYENAGEFIGKSWKVLYDSDELQRFDQEIFPDFGRKGNWHGEALGMKKDGSKFPQEISLTALDGGGLICVVRDITERKVQDASLQTSELLFRKLFEDHAAVKLFVDPDTGNIIDANKAAAVFYGWSREQLKKMKIQEINTLSPEEVKEEMEKARTEKKFHFEFRHRLADGSVRDVDVFSSKIEINKRELLHSIVYDITQRKQAEKQLEDTLERLRKAVSTTIQVMVSTVEARDPYTAGHQIRVADLARAIATKMGLSEDRIEGIRMAGSIHDIGKLSIPAEILSKPTRLTEIEFSLIKEHPEKGYDILKNVESPSPLAEIVFQHHERMDGSGYPRGLKEDEILMEARILAVCDVVEAMASHRPYRPGLGIDKALKEIEANRGILYDADAVDACLRLFREKGFQLKGK